MPALKGRAVYQVVFHLYSPPTPLHGPCRRVIPAQWRGDFPSVMFRCLPPFYIHQSFEDCFLSEETPTCLDESNRLAEATEHYCLVVKRHGSGSYCPEFKSHLPSLHTGHSTSLSWFPVSCHEPHSNSTVARKC